MKNLTAILSSLAMASCMCANVMAADGTTILTVNVPENVSDYQLHIPANMTLEYDNTDLQIIGDLYVTDVRSSIFSIWVYPKYTNLINKDNSDDTIHLRLFDGPFEYKKNGYNQLNGTLNPYYANREPKYSTKQLSAKVDDWSSAKPGATYQATITYVVETMHTSDK
ncbi:MAG: hypothetical protein Q4C49_01420 [Bacillota bacterium]|nr:hypothetical protein [Bacillota bacterium]